MVAVSGRRSNTTTIAILTLSALARREYHSIIDHVVILVGIMYEEFYAVANLPTLCEITYDNINTDDIWLQDEDIKTPYRCRAFSALATGGRPPFKLKGRDVHTSASLYADPVTVGSRSPFFQVSILLIIMNNTVLTNNILIN